MLYAVVVRKTDQAGEGTDYRTMVRATESGSAQTSRIADSRSGEVVERYGVVAPAQASPRLGELGEVGEVIWTPPEEQKSRGAPKQQMQTSTGR
jgi:hypothetical protein